MPKVKTPALVLPVYFLLSFIIGLGFSILMFYLVHRHELGRGGASIITLCWNVFFVMILPLVLDWAEQKHFKAQFQDIDEVAKNSPELAGIVVDLCKKLSLPKPKLAFISSAQPDVFCYGLWGHNPRLVFSGAANGELVSSDMDIGLLKALLEAELIRLSSQDHTMIFFLFAVLQILFQQLLISIFG